MTLVRANSLAFGWSFVLSINRLTMRYFPGGAIAGIGSKVLLA